MRPWIGSTIAEWLIRYVVWFAAGCFGVWMVDGPWPSGGSLFAAAFGCVMAEVGTRR